MIILTLNVFVTLIELQEAALRANNCYECVAFPNKFCSKKCRGKEIIPFVMMGFDVFSVDLGKMNITRNS